MPLGAGVDKLISGPVTCNTISLFSFCFVLQVLEYALNTTNGQEPKKLVPIGARHPLITSWVFCKQMLNQQMAKNLGHDDEVRFLLPSTIAVLKVLPPSRLLKLEISCSNFNF